MLLDYMDTPNLITGGLKSEILFWLDQRDETEKIKRDARRERS
jgi:hypothetical protein